MLSSLYHLHYYHGCVYITVFQPDSLHHCNRPEEKPILSVQFSLSSLQIYFTTDLPQSHEGSVKDVQSPIESPFM